MPMKRTVSACAALAACALVTGTANATSIIYEPFDYTAGSPITGQVNTYSINTGNTTWFNAGTSTAPVHQVANGSLAGPSGPPAFPTSVGNSAVIKINDFTEY